jgi:prolyl-tRNA synthetase
VANQLRPRAEGQWTAADTLKNVVVAVIDPEGNRHVVVIGIPGDRQVDLKRAEATIGLALQINGEVAVEAANAEDLAKHPELIAGYIGPGNGLDQQVLGTEASSGIIYLVDPRIVSGSSWITGANEKGKHVFGLVAERDFSFDGTIESVKVREGDPAPDGSGPLRTERGIEMGHIFQLGRKYAASLDLKVLDKNGKLSVVTMGSYGIGVTRAVAALAEAYHDENGLAWPKQVAPADIHIVVTGKGEELLAAADNLAKEFEAKGMEVIFDDRPKVSAGVKFSDAELIGVPTIVVVGRGLADGVVEVKDRATGERRDVAVADVVEELTA